jgi:peptide/nickel transport system substrate-binding protein
VFFSSDVANPDTYTKFYCDLQMYTTTMTQPDPELFMKQFLTEEQATKANKWQGRNITRWVNKEADEAYKAAEGELDPVKRAALLIKVNDLACNDHAVIPVVYRPRVSASNTRLKNQVSGWDSDLANLSDWYKDA